ncbi:Golgi apparatus membrane protein TVP38 [Suhomyces tanzawaensis NRRL Y-17324]|uniref:Golgi apparatus membrane protein TVP38 n=1 Tax=Suhomyces tanzawaensis NRRL Y-17324 TaxID=984487 RepID=A0A1E4SQX7_9ASCO|nr:Golgi apparatus membrane protein TVP38 [Suhomyces tanzawaensis NRRL Y-17324]ODV81898.1 Golgi apparatus membrane protein TVP38 [Suhomyces tanzawaensis NRRL Y-17324]
MPQLPFIDDSTRSSGYAASANEFVQDKVALLNTLSRQSMDWYNAQPRYKRVLLQILVAFGFVAGLLVLVFHKYIIHILVLLSDSWSELRFGLVILFSLIFLVGFPPLLGFSALSMLCGMIYGFSFGWPLLASASVSGSFCSFLVFRYVLRNQATKLINHNEKFRAFSEILREDSSLLLLILIRLCPLPYSLSNGGLAAIPELSATTFLLASLITCPKLMIHVFVGKKLKELGDETKPKSTKWVDFVSIIITGIAASLTTYIIYNKMQRKLQSYHAAQGTVTNPEQHDRMIFGNFEDDLDSANNVELNSADFDADNFIIEDEDDYPSPKPPSSASSKMDKILDDNLEDLEVGKISNSSKNRNY